MNVLSLFDGMSCGQIALNRLGVNYNNYYASEIDKYAIQITQKNYPSTYQLGDILNWREWDLDWSSISLVTGGFPCQAWSIAGKQLGDRDERGKLFWVMLDVISHVKKYNPEVKFLIENVKMKREFEEYITHHTEEALGKVEKIQINSNLVSAHNRPRFYWTNINNLKQPKDLNINLGSILEDKVDEKYYLSEKILNGSMVGKGSFNGRFKPLTKDSPKSYCLTARYFKMGKTDPYIQEVEGPINSVSSKIRRLTPIECERLQTVPDNYTEGVSNTQRYKMLGNGWTVDVICHILGHEYGNN